MRERDIGENQVRTIVERGGRVPEYAPVGAAPRYRYSGFHQGRRITVIVADEGLQLVIITTY